MIIEPKTKFQHYQNILHITYNQLKSLQSKITNSIYFKLEDKMQQRILNYCKGFCFDWERLSKYIPKQIKLYKNKDNNYYEILKNVHEVIANEQNFNDLKKTIEDKFYEIKAKFNTPIKKELQIPLYSKHTMDIIKTDDKIIFTIDTNNFISAHVMKKFIISTKLSDYHKNILKDKELKNTYTLKLNQYDKIEVIGAFEVDINYPIPNPTEIIGLDIGLKKLIVSSDGEIIEQNKKIVDKVQKLTKNQANRQSLEAHLRKKMNDENFTLPDKNYKKKQSRLINYVKCDNRFRVKQFLNGREDNHIVMEDLKIGYSKTKSKLVNFLLRRMHIQGIKDDLLKYCKEKGIKTTLVNPAYTSQTCPKCGCVDKANRPNQETFKCINCGHEDNADHNASINIMNKYLVNL
jgi:IS605 OrfB family transposase